ncbi:hypothetical protein [Dyella subtropica]|uniref:hypothetical protein n=1 Tax=Dyella subtropica TaxID=2992127 RepID=UPI0022588493|nr:hypothetical protein [Dyella subtropica]
MSRPAAPRTPDAPAQQAAAGNVHLELQRLTLNGYTPGQQQRFLATLQASLERLAADHTGWPADASLQIAHLDAGALASGATPESAARQVAQQLFAQCGAHLRKRSHV